MRLFVRVWSVRPKQVGISSGSLGRGILFLVARLALSFMCGSFFFCSGFYFFFSKFQIFTMVI
ncbi:hypothetical protein BDQ94DRAFT_144943, partial [Aspergillus welwitschiae]